MASAVRRAATPVMPVSATASTATCAGSSPASRASWYRSAYPDLRATAIHPITHYLRWGAREGRDPSWLFSTLDYVGRYPDVAQSSLNPLLHYLRIGKAEGRIIGTHRVLKGASFRETREIAHCRAQIQRWPDDVADDVGFRCAW